MSEMNRKIAVRSISASSHTTPATAFWVTIT